MKLKLLGCLTLALTIGGCDVYDDRHQDNAEDNRARLVIQNASPDAVLLINGETVGRAAAYDHASNPFRLSQGTYVVDVWQADQQQLTSTVVAADGTLNTITVPNPAGQEAAAQ